MKKESLLKNRNLQVIFSITLIAVMGVASLTPALPKMAHQLHLSKTDIALLISVFTFPGIFLTPLAGIIADRWGRKKVLVPSLFIFALSGFAIVFLRNFHLILLMRAFQGVGAASLGSLNITLVGDIFKKEQRARAMGYNAGVLSLSVAFFPLIGGALAGMAWYYPFVLPLMAIPVALFLIYALKEPGFEKAPDFKKYLQQVLAGIFKKEVMAIFLLSVLTFIILYGAFLTYLPFLLSRKFGLSAPKIGLFLSLSSLTTALISTQVGRLTRSYGSLALLKVAFMLYFVVCLLMPKVSSLWFFLFPVLLFGVAQALNIPSLQTVLANLSPDGQRGAFMSINGMVLRLGQTLGPLIIGVGYSLGALTGAYYLAALLALCGLVVLFMLPSDKV